MSLFEELKWRNLITECSDEKRVKSLLDGNKKIKFYCGFDTTAGSLTVGHLVQIITFLLIQKKGHFPIVLLGGATSFIGDPKKIEERKLLDSNQILDNFNKISLQFKKILSFISFEIVNNYDWISKIDIINFLRKYGKLFNINYMLSKEVVSNRLKKGLSYAEFSYMILQSLDFQYLFEHKNVIMQFGGSDQWGNITSGLELIRKINKIQDNNKPVGMTNALLLKSDGNKFGKSEDGVLWLDQKLTSPYKIYQYFLNTEDKEVINYLKSLTLLSKKEIITLQKENITNPRNRLAQKILAKEVITLIHGKKIFENCFKTSQALFLGKKDQLNEQSFCFLKYTLNYIEVNDTISLLEALVLTELTSSKNKARELISSRAIKIFDQIVDNTELILNIKHSLFNKYILLKKGKIFNALIIFR
ncbi:tyrosine--tRNA ligase [Candidatus Phytoplasma prunorum]|uniref:tyrosine--tRNA ligase n=1 Tax=Candidatus Phytoplasma prunorum TaxID=47565 RepID=UPI002FF06FA4